MKKKLILLSEADETKRSKLERAFATHWWQFAPPGAPEPVVEHTFSEKRRFRLDFAWVEHKVALETHGGTWARGRHVRGKGFRADCEKMNLAQLEGWIVLQATKGILEDDPEAMVLMVLDAIRFHRAINMHIHHLTTRAGRL